MLVFTARKAYSLQRKPWNFQFAIRGYGATIEVCAYDFFVWNFTELQPLLGSGLAEARDSSHLYAHPNNVR